MDGFKDVKIKKEDSGGWGMDGLLSIMECPGDVSFVLLYLLAANKGVYSVTIG